MTGRFGHGLVVGKFYPPHRGHQYLIRQAAARCAQVTVLVMAAGCAAFVVAATWGLTLLLGWANDIAPFWDALTTALSLAAQFLLSCKKIENWAFWIAADVVYIPLYVVKRLDLTAIVYVLFAAMCVAGAQAWRRALRSGAAGGTSHEPAVLAGGSAL